MNAVSRLTADVAAALGVEESASVRLLGEGQFSVAMLVGADLVVRFPSHGVGVESLRWERQLVPRIADRVTANLPEPLQGRLDLTPPDAFASHRLVPGLRLTPSMLAELDDAERGTITTQIATFLGELRSLTDVALAAGAHTRTLVEQAARLRSEVDTHLTSRLSASQAARATRELDDLAAAERGTLALCHTDLGGNLIWDEPRQRLGVIDFGDALVSDPALDIASLHALDPLLAAAVADLTQPWTGQSEAHAAIRSTFVLQDILNAARQQRGTDVAKILADY